MNRPAAIAIPEHGSRATRPRDLKLTIEQFIAIEESGALDGLSKTQLLDGRIRVVDAQHFGARHAAGDRPARRMARGEIRAALAAALLAAPLPAAAKVASVSEAGMVVENTSVVAASPDAVWAVLIEPKRWWLASHSWSGKAENFSLDPRAGGCFCESLPGGGSVEHLRVVYADPGKLLRLTGGLGPLQGDAATGPLSWTLQPDGQGTRIVQRYAVAGVARTPWPVMAPLIDSVLRQQLESLAKAIASLRK